MVGKEPPELLPWLKVLKQETEQRPYQEWWVLNIRNLHQGSETFIKIKVYLKALRCPSPVDWVSLKSISCSYSSERFRSLFWFKDTSSFLHFLFRGLSLGYGSHEIRDQEKTKERALTLPSGAHSLCFPSTGFPKQSGHVLLLHQISFPYSWFILLLLFR